MKEVILLSKEEYSNLLNTTNEPSVIMKATNANLKTKVDDANEEIKELKKELAMFSMSSAKTRDVAVKELPHLFDLDSVIVHTYNAMVTKDYQGVTETIDAVVESLSDIYEIDSVRIKHTIKRLTEEGFITRGRSKDRKLRIKG